jgi:uncharacterized protein YqgC (DUF456 family)
MEIVLVILAFLFLLAGLLGSVIPVLPGPPLSYIGLLLLQWSGYGSFSAVFLWVWAAITAAVTIADNVLPALMTKKFGGSRAAVLGSILGLIVGMLFFPPLGLLIGSFLGAFAGEMINNRIKANRDKTNDTESGSTVDNSADNRKALQVALGTFLAFIMGTGAKLIIGSLMIYYAVKAVLS